MERKSVNFASTFPLSDNNLKGWNLHILLSKELPTIRSKSQEKMHPSLFEAIVRNDREMLSSLIQENGNTILDRTTNSGLETALHLAAKYGKEDLVMEIVKLKPEMVLAENKNLETPLHEACRQGNPRVVLMLLEAHPWVACKLNCNNQSALFLSSSNGHLDVVKILLSQPWLLGLEDDDDVSMSSLHVAASKGHTDIVREILKASPNLAQKMDENGCNPLHHACSEGHLDITRMLLKHDKGMSLRVNNNGHTPLHLAAINGDTTTLKAFMEMDPVSFHRLTTDGETVFHLAARFNRQKAFKFLAGAFSDTRLLHCPDQFGNTVLHVGLSGGHYLLAGFIINETRVKINQQNARGLTALDMVANKAENIVELSSLRETLVRAGGKTSSSEEEESPRHALEREYDRIIAPSRDYYSFENIHQISTSGQGTSSPQIGQNSTTKTAAAAAAEPFKRDSQLRREELIKIYKMQHKKNRKVYIEALQNARNTIILVAILIATVTFAAGINPPGGVHQEGRLGGRSMVGRTTAFRIFMISNNIALFTSLGIVVVLVSIIPFRRKPLMKLLRVAHKVLWVAVAFMAVAYVAGTCVIMPHGREGSWVFEVSVAIFGGGFGTVFLWLGVVLVKHWLRKTKWREEEEKKREGDGDGNGNEKGDNNESLSSNSDVHSTLHLGYHAY